LHGVPGVHGLPGGQGGHEGGLLPPPQQPVDTNLLYREVHNLSRVVQQIERRQDLLERLYDASFRVQATKCASVPASVPASMPMSAEPDICSPEEEEGIQMLEHVLGAQIETRCRRTAT
jgi:hypothetical protein